MPRHVLATRSGGILASRPFGFDIICVIAWRCIVQRILLFLVVHSVLNIFCALFAVCASLPVSICSIFHQNPNAITSSKVTLVDPSCCGIITYDRAGGASQR
jgi:hypothetical protein